MHELEPLGYSGERLAEPALERFLQLLVDANDHGSEREQRNQHVCIDTRRGDL